MAQGSVFPNVSRVREVSANIAINFMQRYACLLPGVVTLLVPQACCFGTCAAHKQSPLPGLRHQRSPLPFLVTWPSMCVGGIFTSGRLPNLFVRVLLPSPHRGDPTAHGHQCTFTDVYPNPTISYHAMPCHTIPLVRQHVFITLTSA